MTENELHIGNIVDLYGNFTKIHHSDFAKWRKDDGSYPDFKPVPLTSVILSELGFKWNPTIRFKSKLNYQDGIYLISKASGIGVRYNEVDGDYEIWLLNCDYIPTYMVKYVKYTHTLQNLFNVISEEIKI